MTIPLVVSSVHEKMSSRDQPMFSPRMVKMVTTMLIAPMTVANPLRCNPNKRRSICGFSSCKESGTYSVQPAVGGSSAINTGMSTPTASSILPSTSVSNPARASMNAIGISQKAMALIRGKAISSASNRMGMK